MHTPGPWETTYREKYHPFKFSPCHTIAAGDGHVVAIVPRFFCVHAANARLIAAAPELFAACKELVQRFEQEDSWCEAVALHMETVREAIRKAEM